MDNTPGKIRNAVGKLFDRGTHLSVASSTQFVAKKLGLREKWINYTHIEIRNKANETNYINSQFNERVIFLPHCMRNLEKCKAKYNEDGLQCLNCGACKLGELTRMGKEKGYKAVIICPGGSMVKKKIEQLKPKAILGIACFDEAQMAFDALKGTDIGVQAVLLSKAGCINTDVDLEEFREKLDLINEEIIKTKKPKKTVKKKSEKKR